MRRFVDELRMIGMGPPVLAALVLGWAASAAACSSHRPGAVGAQLEQEILRQVAAYDAATLRGDSAALTHLLADEYRYVSPAGRVFGKDEALAWTQSPAYRLQSGRSDGVLVRVYGDAAVVIGRWTATGTNRGVTFRDQDRYTSVYVWRDGRWQLISDHVSSIVAP